MKKSILSIEADEKLAKNEPWNFAESSVDKKFLWVEIGVLANRN